MANKILTTETYHEEIRGRLGVGEDVISDADIDALSVLPIGESRIVKAIPDYAELTGDDQTYVYAAAVCMVAAILAPSMTARIKKSKRTLTSLLKIRLLIGKSTLFSLLMKPMSLSSPYQQCSRGQMFRYSV